MAEMNTNSIANPAIARPIGSPAESYDCVMRMLNQLRPRHVLDCPGGEGFFSQQLINAGYQVSSCDICPERWRIPAIPCSFADLNDALPYADNEFDAIACLNGLHRVWARGRALRELARVLKPEGHLLLTFVNNINLAHRVGFLLSGSVLPNAAGPPHAFFPEATNPGARFRYGMTLADVLGGAKSVGLKISAITGVRRSFRSWLLSPLAIAQRLTLPFLPGAYKKHCFVHESSRMSVLLSDYLLVVAQKPS